VATSPLSSGPTSSGGRRGHVANRIVAGESRARSFLGDSAFVSGLLARVSASRGRSSQGRDRSKSGCRTSVSYDATPTASPNIGSLSSHSPSHSCSPPNSSTGETAGHRPCHLSAEPLRTCAAVSGYAGYTDDPEQNDVRGVWYASRRTDSARLVGRIAATVRSRSTSSRASLCRIWSIVIHPHLADDLRAGVEGWGPRDVGRWRRVR
jgi:hypothetical protein